MHIYASNDITNNQIKLLQSILFCLLTSTLVALESFGFEGFLVIEVRCTLVVARVVNPYRNLYDLIAEH